MAALARPAPLFAGAVLLRLGLLVYGSSKDAHSAVKYTDVDYLVFTDAARLVARHARSPYDRDTYRYTPLLAWLLAPAAAAAAAPALFAWGKLVFAAADLLAGALLVALLRRRYPRRPGRAALAALWLWNPMVATISTRGSSEGLLAVLTMALLWAVEARRLDLAAVVLGLAVHFKIYPFIYAPAIVWWMDDARIANPSSSPPPSTAKPPPSLAAALVRFCSPARLRLALISFATFAGLNMLMYSMFVRSFFFPSTHDRLTRRRLQIRNPLSRPHVPAPRLPHRPSPQLLPLQHPLIHHLGRSLCVAAHRVPRLRAPASLLLRPHPPRRRQERSRHLLDGPDLCLCHLQQGLHLAGKRHPRLVPSLRTRSYLFVSTFFGT